MKKIIYTIVFAVLTSLAISSCTEQEIQPATDLNGGGAGSADGKL